MNSNDNGTQNQPELPGNTSENPVAAAGSAPQAQNNSNKTPLTPEQFAAVRKKVFAPACGLIIASIIMFSTSFIGIYMSFLSKTDWNVVIIEKVVEISPEIKKETPFNDQYIKDLKTRDRTFEHILNAIFVTIGLVTNIIVLAAGLNMLKLKNQGLCVTGSLIALVFNGCCCAGLPMGIWSLVTLSQPSVRRAFAQNKSAST